MLRRVLLAVLTDAGLALCPAAREVWARLERIAFGHLAAETRAELTSAMDASRAALFTAGRRLA